MSNLPDLEAILECIICHVVPRNGPIFQCTNGHLVCEECSEKTAAAKSCSVCQVRLPHTKSRCIAAEQVIEKTDFVFDCVNAGDGCHFSAVRKRLQKHEGSCEARMVPCPDAPCKESLPLNKLLQHLEFKTDRYTPVYKDAVLTAKFTCSDMTLQNLGWRVQICKHAINTFFAKFVRVNGIFYTWLYIVADEDVAKKYQVKITIANPTIFFSCTWKVFPIDLKEEVMFERDDVLTFGESLFRKMMTLYGEFHEISIDYEILEV
jgi:hypothetical protein